jgi:drug/metabolite transporter (DMT)-like permease
MNGLSLQDRNAWVRLMPWVFVLIWSSGFIVARYAMPHAPPLKFLSLRFALSVGCFLLWIWWRGVRWPTSASQWRHLAVTGILIQGGYLGGVWLAIKDGMGSGLTSLIVGLQPVLTAVWISTMGRADASVSKKQWAGLWLGFLGLVLVVSRKFETGSPGDTATLTNLVFVVVALLSITAGTLYQKRYVQPCDVRSANAVQLMAALLLTLPFALMETEAMRWNGELVGALATAVLVLTLGGSSLFYMLIQRGAAASVTSLLYLVPPCTAMMAWWLFDEPITAVTLLGTALTAWGVSWVVRSPTPNSGKST